MSRTRAFAVLVLSTWLSGCDKGGDSGAVYPPSEVYEMSSNFSGQWVGEIAGVTGLLEIQALGGGRYYGSFRSDDGVIRYALNMQQQMGSDGTGKPTNQARFTWQDGRGGRGEGWLLINREDSALAGEFGQGEGSTSGFGEWTMIRLE